MDFLEAELQAYVEANLERSFTRWLGRSVYRVNVPVRLLGAQVACSSGIIDALGAIGPVPVIVELKAKQATERTAGQLLRYKAAVERFFERQCLEYALNCDLPDCVYASDFSVMSVVIAPSFSDQAVAALSGIAHLLKAERQATGGFSIAPYTHDKPFVTKEPEAISGLLLPLTREYVGWRFGASLARSHQRVLESLPFDEPPSGVYDDEETEA